MHTLLLDHHYITTLEMALLRRDDVNLPVGSFQSQTGKCFRSEDVAQACLYSLKLGLAAATISLQKHFGVLCPLNLYKTQALLNRDYKSNF